jgi:ABC-type multidrug transport system fused ATPase/permease subunit
MNGDTVSDWANQRIVEKRLKIDVIREGDDLRVVRVTRDGIADHAGLHKFDSLTNPTTNARAVLSQLSDPAVSAATIYLEPDRPIHFNHLPRVPWYWAIGRQILQKFPTGPISSIAAVLAVCVAISLFGNFVRYFQEHYADRAAIYAVNDIRRRLYDHVLHVPMEFFARSGTSDVTSRLVQDCQGLQDGFTSVLGQSIQMPINAIGAFILALTISWKLTLFIVLFAPIMVAIIRTFGKKMRRANRRALQSSSSMLGQIEATLLGIRVVKGSNAERFERRRYSQIMDGLKIEQVRMSRLDAISAPTMEILMLLVVCVVVLWATNLIQVRGELKPDQFFGVMACLATIAESLRRFGKLNNVLQRSGAAASRIFQIMSVPVERPRHMLGRSDRPKIKLPAVSEDIRFENVSFAYANNSNLALSNVSLTVKKGECVAIVGRNGSGKTTLAALLPRFYDPQAGRVLIDGIDVRDATLRSLRSQITVVTQESVIFPGTIAQNIAYGSPLATKEQIESAARRAFAHDFIVERADGYQTLLGELGGSMSGGQKQRLNIARAMLRATPILILDEATSQVDAESESLIQKAIDSLMHERTTFVIAHRLGTILSADRIVVMDRGQVIAAGKHEELLKSCETYKSLYERHM